MNTTTNITSKQLAKDIKNLVKKIKAIINTKDDFVDQHPEIKDEFYRIYHLDDKFAIMNKQSILIMFRLNIRYRFIAFHSFGIYIDIPGLDD